MGRKLFGTDGIRGRANSFPMTAEIAMKVGMAAGRLYTRGDYRHRVVIGKDTRLSGYMIESALTAGFTAVGMDVFLFGPLPTPAVAILTRSLRADLGVMISASHNPYCDNGIKIFGPDGYKLSDARESEIEALMENGLEQGLAASANIGRAKRIDDAQARYIEVVKHTFPRHLRLDGLRVVVDCAHGASYKVAPAVLWELGAEVITLGVDPNGMNENLESGSTAPQSMCNKVREVRADFGIAFDGDADRCLAVDEDGNMINGDQIMGILARAKQREGKLNHDTLVVTVMSNLGLKLALKDMGIKTVETAVGDRYVLEEMLKGDYSLGGEQSGHVINREFATTGDGTLTALTLCNEVVKSGKSLKELAADFPQLPQTLINVPNVDKMAASTNKRIQDAVAREEKMLGDTGRVLLRPSGTEPLVRVMAEAETQQQADEVCDRLAKVVADELTL